MIYLQFKTNSLKIGSSVPSISLNYGRNWAKRPNDGLGKGNSCRLFVIRGKKYMHCQSEILSSHDNLDWNLKGKQKQTNKNKSMPRRHCISEMHMRNTIVWENSFFVNLYKTCSFVENQCFVYKSNTISFYYINNKYDKSTLETMMAYFCPLQGSYFSTDYVNMQDTYVNIQDKYVNMQDNYIKMQD